MKRAASHAMQSVGALPERFQDLPEKIGYGGRRIWHHTGLLLVVWGVVIGPYGANGHWGLRRSAALEERRRSRLKRGLLIVFVVFCLAVGGIAVAAWFAGDTSDLEMEYEGFD